jgi:CPA2 family monovalent cation:H+ antiporter-2
MLTNRGEFALILATLAAAAGLDPRLTPFAGLYVLAMAIIGPVIAVNSERIGARVFRPRRRITRAADDARDHDFAVAEAAMSGAPGDDTAALEVAAGEPVDFAEVSGGVEDDVPPREPDPEY